MRVASILLAFGLLWFAPSGLVGQDDPFSGDDAERAASSDPFGESDSSKDPFDMSSSSDDPFGASERNAKPRSVSHHGHSKPATVTIAVNVANYQIRDALSQSTRQSFEDSPLDEAVRLLAESHGIPILLDRLALDETGLSVDKPVSITPNNISLRSFLRLMRQPMDLTYTARDGALIITTIESAEQNLPLRAYRLDGPLAGYAEKVIASPFLYISGDRADHRKFGTHVA